MKVNIVSECNSEERGLWILDARPSPSGGVVLELFDEGSGLVRELPVDLHFYGYIEAPDPYAVSRELVYEGIVENAWVEEWFTPPYYRGREEIVVFSVKSLHELRRITSTAEKRGLRPVNKYPHPLVESLYKGGVRPLTRVCKADKGLTIAWRPSERDPGLRSMVVDVRNGAYIVGGKTPIKFYSVRDLAAYIAEHRPQLAFTEPSVYLRLASMYPEVKEYVGKWVLGGAFSPHEYFEWSRLSFTPLSLMNNVTIGRLLTTIEVLASRDLKYIVRKDHSRPEHFRRITDLILLDRGGVVFKPRPGLYWGVCQVDFKSLYPSIIAKLNISGETVNDPGCGSKVSLDYVAKEVCVDRRGVVPMSLEILLELKELYEQLYKATGDELYYERRSAVKWLLVASFGYLGYRNSLFGSIMAHEAVTATSREIMKRASEEVARRGYKVVHAIVDSLFIGGVADAECCAELAAAIEGATGYKTKVEAYYVWLYLPRELDGSRGVANRYYGLLHEGGLKIKGVLAVRRDTPEIVRQAELEALSKLAEARDPLSMAEALSTAYDVVKDYERRLLENVDVRLLLMTRSRRARGSYKRPPRYVLEGDGASHQLIALKSGLAVYDERVSAEDIDLGYYLRLLEKVRKELPTPEDVFSAQGFCLPHM